MDRRLHYFTAHEAATFEAVAARIWPGTPVDPGAREGGAVYYLDRALSGAYAGMQQTYRQGLAALDALSRARHGIEFVHLSDAYQDATLADLEAGGVEEFDGLSSAEFFHLCVTHTMEGMFSDPIHGGNRDFAGWRAVGYPGAQPGYTAEEHLARQPLRRAPRSIADP
jgi:gluconate 2-dehydrogenase gamma chain